MATKGTSRYFDEANIELLKRLYPTTPASDIATMVGCSATQVLRKAHQLGLQRDPSFDSHNFLGRYTGRGKYKQEYYARRKSKHSISTTSGTT
jgi:hypothetical protein